MIALIAREVRLATRTGGGAALGLVFFLIVILITALGIGRDADALSRVAPGALWTAALLANVLSLDRMFQADFEDGSLDGLALAPVPLEAVVIAKIAGHWLTTGLPLVIAAPVMGLMLNLPGGYGWMLAALALGSLSLSAIGAVGAALTVSVRRGGLLLSLLTLPLFVPTLIFGVRVVADAGAGQSPLTPAALLAGVCLVSVAVAPVGAAAALRIQMS